MTAKRPASVEAMCLMGEFEALRAILSAEVYAPHRQRPLAAWVESADRRLPLPFLNWTVGEILQTPFRDLQNTPGIGQRKLRTLICLLERVRQTDPSSLVAGGSVWGRPESDRRDHSGTEAFDPTSVSEVVWAQWRTTAARLQLHDEPLGRLARSLRELLRTLWHQPLKNYLERSLQELYSMRIYGHRRVRSILEVFFDIHRLAASFPVDSHLTLRFLPRHVAQAEAWLWRQWRGASQNGQFPALEEFHAGLVMPLLEQLRLDAKPGVIKLAEERLGCGGPRASIRQIARRLGLTRARIYQLLQEITEIMNVRWPEGKEALVLFQSQLLTRGGTEEAKKLDEHVAVCLEVFFGEAQGHPAPLKGNKAQGNNARKTKPLGNTRVQQGCEDLPHAADSFVPVDAVFSNSSAS